MKKDVITNFTEFTGKHMSRSVFLIKLKASDMEIY